ncbi:MAG TPA: DUF4279 domain-containing protein [Gaiellaceae bacterium]|nr:DUF4279 domain-containing protein [Gaiellaceae bacterium]
MRVTQYVHFAAFSSELTAAEIEKRVGVIPDEVLVRGSKDPERPLPIQHMWAVSSQQRELSLYEQVAEVLSRIAPIEAALTDLLPRIGDGGYVLQIVRHLNDPDAPETKTLALGFGFERAHLQLLDRLSARIDVDEYDYSLGDE